MVEDVAEPVIHGPHQVILRIGGAGVCGTDLQLVQGLWRTRIRMELPLILGHENAGWVEEVGSGVESVRVGDPVIVHPMGGLSGRDYRPGGNPPDENAGFFPGFTCNGGFAEYMLADERMLVRLPTALSPLDAAPLADAGLTSYSAARQASSHLGPGDYALVLGAGGLGHLGIQVLRALCTSEIIAVDTSQAALDLARRSGAHYTLVADGNYVDKVMALTRGVGVEAVIDYVGRDSTVQAGLEMAARGGRYYVAGTGGRLTISTLDLVLGEKNITGILNGSLRDLKDLVTMADRGLVSLATEEYPLTGVNQALSDLKEGKKSGRLVLIP